MDKKERRPRRWDGAPDDAHGGGISHRLQAECPLVRAAIRIGDPGILAAVARIHPVFCCPAARRERAR